MIVLLHRDDVAASFGLAVPVRLLRVHERRDRMMIDLPADLIKEIELELRQDLHFIRNAGVLHVLHRRVDDVARVLRERTVLGIVDDHRVADHRKRLNRAEGIDHRGIQIGNVDHVALFDDGIAVVGCVEADAVLQRFLGKVCCRNGHMTELSVDVDDFEVDHLDVLFLDERHNFLCGHKNANPPFLISFQGDLCPCPTTF